jgi:hypothetical protein
MQNASNFFTTADLEDYSGVKLISVFSAITSAWQDDDGLVRKNLRLGKTKPENLFPPITDQAVSDTEVEDGPFDDDDEELDDDEEDHDGEEDDIGGDADLDGMDDPYFPAGIPLLKEKRVKVGEKVCAIGVYSGQRQGLIPGGLGADKFIKLIRGTATNIERNLRRTAFWRFVGGVIALVVVHAVAYGVMQAAQHDPDQMRKRHEEAFKIARDEDGNVVRLAKLISRGVDVNAQDGQGRTLLAVSQNPTIRQWLVEHGGMAAVPAEKSEQ